MNKSFNHETTNNELKTCPFCGTTPIWYHTGNDITPKRSVTIKCPNCRINMTVGGIIRLNISELETIIINKWNNRI